MLTIYLFLFSCCLTAGEVCPITIFKEILQHLDGVQNLTHPGRLSTPNFSMDENCIRNSFETFFNGLSLLNNRNDNLVKITSNINSLKNFFQVTESNCSSVDLGLDEFLYTLKRFIAWQWSTKCKVVRRSLRRMRKNKLCSCPI